MFNLTLAETGQWYKLKTDSETVRQTLVDFHHLGLVTMKKVTDFNSKFCVNSLLKTFLDKGVAKEKTVNQFIVVESNFKLYAYTDSRLYQAILRLFMR